VEWCALWRLPASFLVTLPSLFLGFNFPGMFLEQMIFIGAELTVRNVSAKVVRACV
jgi:hypothetical protein